MSKIPCGGFKIDDRTLKFKGEVLTATQLGAPEDVGEEIMLAKGDNTTIYDGNGIEVENKGTDIVSFGVGNFVEDGVLSAHPGVYSTSTLHINASSLILHKTPVLLESENGTIFQLQITNDGKLKITQV